MIKILDLVNIKFPLPDLNCSNDYMGLQLTYTVSEQASIVWTHILMSKINGIICRDKTIKNIIDGSFTYQVRNGCIILSLKYFSSR